MALVIVLGVVALVSAWAATAAYEDMVSLHRAENMQESSRAWLASESALVLARLYLQEDRRDNQTDDLDELWAQPIPPMPVDNGLISGSIEDANRYFNLNDLVDQEGRVQDEAVVIARQLFSDLDIPDTLVEKLVDWMDRDHLPMGAGGAEDAHYYDKPYRVKNARLDRWQELGLIDGFDHEVLGKLKQVATVRAVPESGKTLLNINTINEELLLALFPQMTESDAAAFVERRPYAQVQDAVNHQAWADGVDTSRLSVASDAFIVRTEALFGRARWREEYLLIRAEDGKTAVEYRQRIGWSE